jgi:nucleoporin NUP159
MNMAESKSGDIDILEAQMKKLGLSVSGGRNSHEGSPFTTPLKQSTGLLPVTPGSRTSREDGPVSAYHTPELTDPPRFNVPGPAKPGLLRSAHGGFLPQQERERWQVKAHRRKEILDNLKRAVGAKKARVRGVGES